ncbi:MAG: serine hydrolase domain-containing protein [Pseudomonadota bacterium]
MTSAPFDSAPEIMGAWTPGFDGVVDAFRSNFAGGSELGAGLAVMRRGETLVNIWAGVSDPSSGRLWDADTLTPVFSTGKAVIAALAALAVDDGAFAYEDLVAKHWPEFAANGKGEVTIGQLLSHQAGLAGFDDAIDRADWLSWETIAGRLAAAAPLWPPGSASGYHPQTFGYLAGEIYRRTTGRSLGDALRSDKFASLAGEIWFGLDGAANERIASMTKPPKAPDLGPITDIRRAAFLRPWSSPGKPGDPNWRKAEIPASNGHATAAGLADLLGLFAWGGAAGGLIQLSDETRRDAMAERIRGDDLVLPLHISWAAGLIRNSDLGLYGPNPEAVGHSGWGGSCAFADPGAELSFAYATNKMSEHLVGDPRALRLIEATYAALT